MSEFDKVMDRLILINEKYQLDNPPLRKWLWPTEHAREIATVNVNIHRRCGMTSYIISRARPCDLVIVGNRDMLQVYKNANTKVMTASEVQAGIDGHWAGRSDIGPYNRLWIDGPMMVFDERGGHGYLSREKMYYYFAEKVNQFIMLGT